ncbi:hypothetical protein [Luteibacter aegosomaticola]|jgi:hypothetical protein|nr:hypothetical protein [Luteibacter aegosomaticola]
MHIILLLQTLEVETTAPGIETQVGSSYSGAGCIAGLADVGEG